MLRAVLGDEQDGLGGDCDEEPGRVDYACRLHQRPILWRLDVVHLRTPAGVRARILCGAPRGPSLPEPLLLRSVQASPGSAMAAVQYCRLHGGRNKPGRQCLHAPAACMRCRGVGHAVGARLVVVSGGQVGHERALAPHDSRRACARRRGLVHIVLHLPPRQACHQHRGWPFSQSGTGGCWAWAPVPFQHTIGGQWHASSEFPSCFFSLLILGHWICLISLKRVEPLCDQGAHAVPRLAWLPIGGAAMHGASR